MLYNALQKEKGRKDKYPYKYLFIRLYLLKYAQICANMRKYWQIFLKISQNIYIFSPPSPLPTKIYKKTGKNTPPFSPLGKNI